MNDPIPSSVFIKDVLGKSFEDMSGEEISAIERIVNTTNRECMHKGIGGICRPPTLLNDGVARVVNFMGEIGLACEKHARMIRATENKSYVPLEYFKNQLRDELTRRRNLQVQAENAINDARDYIAFRMSRRDGVDKDEVTAKMVDMYIENNREEYERLLESMKPAKRFDIQPKPAEPEAVTRHSSGARSGFRVTPRMQTASVGRH